MSITDLPQRKVGTRTVRRFESWREYVAAAESSANGPGGQTSHGPERRERDGDWYETKTFNSALSLAREGWSDIRPEVDSLSSKIDAVISPAVEPTFVNYFDVAGDSVDIGRYLDGEPECMIETRLAPVAKPGRVVTLLVDGFYSSGVKSADIRKRGVAIVALVDALTKLQHSTEIWIETSFRNSTLTYLICVKKASQDLNIDTLMFAVAHPSAFRRINFGLQEGEDRKFQVGDRHSYGRPAGLLMGETVGANVELPRLVWGEPTVDGEVWIKNVLSKFGLLKGGK